MITENTRKRWINKRLLIILLMTVSQVSICQDQFLNEFSNPSPWYHTAPLWVWNDDITEEEIEDQLEMLRSQEVLQAFVHPRPGLITPYLSDRWLDLYAFAVKTAKANGMLLHIYDENSYPSGFAGGHIYRLHPEWAGRGLVWEDAREVPLAIDDGVLAVYRKEGDSVRRLDSPRLGQTGDFRIAKIVVAETKAWTGGGPYVDLLAPGLTEEFLKVTYEPYRERFGEEFGQTVLGAFTDEPHLVPAGSLHWSPRLPQLFEDRYGYSLLDAIPSLFEDTSDYRKARFDFYQLLLDEFIERWSKPYHDYCEKHHLQFTGHYWEHEWPRASRAQDNMAMYAFHQMPAIDCLMNRYSEDPHAQFGNVRAVMELSSIANQLGMERRLCEVYGAGGWEMTFEDQKRIADWLGVLGVNFFNQHLTYMTLRGARKRDHPLSFSNHQPWWDQYHILAKYLARLSYALSQGEEQKRILVLEPTTTGWMLDRAKGPREELEWMGSEFQAFITNLSLNQIEYDLGSERTIRDHGRVEGGKFVVGNRKYDLLILHRTCQNLSRFTFDLIGDFYEEMGTLLCVGGIPKFIDGLEDTALKSVFRTPLSETQCRFLEKAIVDNGTIEQEANLVETLKRPYCSVIFPKTHGGKIFHQLREVGDNRLLFLCNTSADELATGNWIAEGGGVSLLNLFTGKEESIPFNSEGSQVAVDFELLPAGSALYRITQEKLTPASVEEKNYLPLEAKLIGIRRLHPNALPLDYVDYTVGNKSGKDTFFFEAQTAIYRAHGFEMNPWDRAVQFRECILEMEGRFGPQTGFSVTYPFTVDGFDISNPIELLIEQPERYTVYLNEAVLTGTMTDTVDPHFKKIRCEEGIQSGVNWVTLKASPFSVHHEVEPVYVLGDFHLKARETGWAIHSSKELEYGSWCEQGMPFYSGAVRYSYEIESNRSEEWGRLSLVNWKGVVATAMLNDEPIGILGWPPYQVEFSSIREGKNKIDIDVYGSLKNLYGPHHGEPELGAAWPSGFLNAPKNGPPPGTEYDVLGYGFFEAPIIEICE